MSAAMHPFGFGSGVQPENIPVTIRGGRWCVWHAVPKPNKPDKFDKIPSNGFLNLSPYQLENWLTFDQALNVYQDSPTVFNGIGKLILPDDNITVIDLDGVDPGFVDRWIGAWPTYWERSPSGLGLRGISLGRALRDMSKPIEVYAGHGARFLTFTGDVVHEAAPVDLASQINAYIAQYAGANTLMSEIPDMPEPEDPQAVLERHPAITYEDGADRSEENFKIAYKMIYAGTTAEEVFSLFVASEEVWQMAWEHRPRSDDNAQYQAACEYLWRDVCKAEKAAREQRDAYLSVFKPVQQPEVVTTPIGGAMGNPLAWLDQFTPTDDSMNEIGNEVFLYPDLIIQSHLVVVPAPPESGKTTVFLMIAKHIAHQGYVVDYINADCPAPHAKEYHFRAQQEGFNMRLPDYTAGGSMSRVVEGLKWMAAQPDVDLSNNVLIFDTLKKMTDVIHKKEAKDLFATLRALTAKGATIILLAHTNKYRVDGEHIFEGTGDIKSDCDDLVYLESLPDDSRGRKQRTITVSTRLDKFRGVAEPISFHVDTDRVVTQMPAFVDVSKQVEARMSQDEDANLIEAVKLELGQVPELIQMELVRRVQETEGAGRPRILTVLTRYAGVLWHRVRQVEHNNRIIYALTPFDEAEK